jgi:hypothetical protein
LGCFSIHDKKGTLEMAKIDLLNEEIEIEPNIIIKETKIKQLLYDLKQSFQICGDCQRTPKCKIHKTLHDCFDFIKKL